jgi:hypothetical protein
MKKILASFVLIVWFLSLMFAVFAPFASPWWFILTFVVALIAIPYGFKIQDWIFETLEKE